MINHARTLLMNTQYNDFRRAGEEILDPDFRLLSTEPVQAVRSVLFGTSPDGEMLNYRCRQLLSLVHATELEQYLLDLDPRVTYDTADTQLMDESLFNPVVLDFADAPAAVRLETVDGAGAPPDSTGRVAQSWRVVVDGVATGPLRASVAAAANLGPSQAYTLELNSGWSTPAFTLPGSSLRVRLHWTALPTSAPTGSWTVTTRTRPQSSLAELENALKGLGEPVLGLFGRGTPVGSEEPYNTLWNLWRNHPAIEYRLGGLVVALVYRMERIRNE